MQLQSSSGTYPHLINTASQPFVKWAGGKTQLLEYISSRLPRNYDRYFEPFLGGGAVFFSLRPTSAVVSDANLGLINAYKAIKHDLDGLVEKLDYYQKHKLSERFYYLVRSMDTKDLSSTERAARFIFLNKTCYNGLYRVNSSGDFNVPFGKYRKIPKLYERGNLESISKLLQNARLLCADYHIPLKRCRERDFVYLDPPYCPPFQRNGFTGYTEDSFSQTDQERLARVFKELDRLGCFVMLSNSDTPFVRRLYSDYMSTTHILTTNRMINCVGSERRGFSDLLILNYPSDSHSIGSDWVGRDLNEDSAG